MKHLARIDVNIKNVYNGPVDIVEWTTADPFPHLGNEVGVDTETELITETNLAPPLVVLGVFDPQSATCYISYCEDAKVFINQLSKLEVRQYYFNLGFDEQVLDNEDPEKALMDAIEMGRVRDMQVRTQLHDIATKGFIPYNHYSLEDCSRLMLDIQLDKGEKDDPNSHRLTFRRGTKITQEQAIYLCWDCMSTFYLSTKIPEQPTEIQHTKGMCVLAHISQNGFPIDIRVYNAFKDKLQKAKDEYRAQLLTFGFPDPYAKDRDENGEYREFVVNKSEQFISLVENRSEFGQLNICKSNVRMALLYMYNFSDDKDHWQDVEESCAYWLTCEKPKTLRKAEKAIYDEMLIELDCLEAYFSAGKEIVMNALLGHVLEDLLNQQENKLERGYDFKHAVEYAAEIIDDNSHWLTNEKQVGPVTFTQNHYKNLLKQYPKLELPMTAGGSYKLTLQDRWRLDDLDIKDPFLEVLTNYRHVEKFLSTYFNPEHLKPDVKVHPRFSNIKRTGRTSATAPPVQTLPSRESVYSLKNMFCPPKGAILCATDFSFVEWQIA